MKHLLVLSFALALAALPVRSDLECTGFTIDSSGNQQPWQCPPLSPGLLSHTSESSIGLSEGVLSVDFFTSLIVDIEAPAGLDIIYQGESSTSSTGEFVVSGGSGTGELIGFDYSGEDGYGSNGEVDDFLTSDFGLATTLPFTFGVPFTLTLADTLTFRGDSAISSNQNWGYEHYVDITYTNIVDSNGNLVPGASISEVPEPSSLAFLVTVAGGLGLILRRRRAC